MRRRQRPSRLLGLLAATALVTAACTTDDGTSDDGTTDDAAQDETAQEGEPDPDPEAPDDAPGDLGEQELELPDPTEYVEAGVFRGVGVMLPAPEGWTLDEMSFAQGMVVAVTDDGAQTLAAQAVDTAELPEDLDYDELLEASRDDLGGDPDVDEEVELAGAERAQMLRTDAVPSPQEGAPDNAVLAVLADDGDGRLAMFNYVAPADEYDEDTEALLLSEAGFDPDSEPGAPMPAGQG